MGSLAAIGGSLRYPSLRSPAEAKTCRSLWSSPASLLVLNLSLAHSCLNEATSSAAYITWSVNWIGLAKICFTKSAINNSRSPQLKETLKYQERRLKLTQFGR
ncbi:Uncharacterized protein Adt_30505 [Abeliophyllum distichum]|uniref:Uncharacterized protein n=1 Tax=Abeliophyllum distichum TaxID=126358 RepID=A0ABD1RBF1_9LAMI